MKLEVEAYSGHKADERPIRFRLGEHAPCVASTAKEAIFTDVEERRQRPVGASIGIGGIESNYWNSQFSRTLNPAADNLRVENSRANAIGV